MRFQPIAVVGAGCVLPGAAEPDTFWRNIADGHVSLSTVPPDRWRPPRSAVLGAVDDAADRTWTDQGGYVRGFDEVFDPEGFDLAAERIAGLDPSCRWVLHAARSALSGLDDLSAGTGLVLGNLSFPSETMARYAEDVWLSGQSAEVREALDPRPARPDATNRFFSALPARVAARAFRLGAGAFTLDAACASALYAIKLACDRLHDRRADVMLAGGVNGADDLFVHIGFCALSAMSRTGCSRPFHQQADGLVPAEGAAVVALMRLDDAVRRSAPILGVIRGIGLSNDGGSGGLLAPAQTGQVRAMRSAYDMAGIDPGAVSFVECHATGTAIGDAVEARAVAEVFGRHGPAIGSVKSNIGHPITAAGAAGVLKVLGAMRAGILPATPGVDETTDALDGTGLRLLHENEPWHGPKLAAVSAFGFGGNNAHLLVEEYSGDQTAPAGVVAPRAEPVAIVSIGARVADGSSLPDLVDGLLTGTPRPGTATVTVDLDGLGIPPKDLEQTHPQQLLILEAAREAVSGTRLPTDRTMVLVGMECATEVARNHARWWVGTDRPAWAKQVRDAFGPPLSAPAVLGAMPNIVANRLNALFDVTGPGFSVSADEASGLVALDVAVRALVAGEADAALVGGVDLSDEPVHRAALIELGDEREPGDAAVVLVLKRLADARRDGDRVIATLDQTGPGGLVVGEDHFDPADLFGRPHAASGLLSVASAALALRHRAAPAADGAAGPLLDHRGAEVVVAPLDAPSVRVGLRAADPVGWIAEAPPRIHVYSGPNAAAALTAAERGAEDGSGPARLVVLATGRDQLAERVAAARRWLTSGGVPPEGVTFRAKPIGGDVAFVYTNGSASYPGMGRELMLAFPETMDELNVRCGQLTDRVGWAYERSAGANVLGQIWGASLLCQLHTEITTNLLGIKPRAAFGYSSGESAALVALRAWRDVPGLVADISTSPLFTTGLVGELRTVRDVWRQEGVDGPRWTTWLVTAPVDRVREFVDSSPSVYLMAINAPDVCVIGGEAGACAGLVSALAPGQAVPVPYEIAVHAPVVAPVAREWHDLHSRPTHDVPGVRFYSGATGEPYALNEQTAADAITAQAVGTIHFDRMVRRAWTDGVRVFVEHGPGAQCTSWIRRTLGEQEHLAVAVDGAGTGQLAKVAAELIAAGVPVDANALFDRLASLVPARPAPSRPLTLPAHLPAVIVPAPHPAPARMAPAPALPPDDEWDPPTPPPAVGVHAAVTHLAAVRDATASHQRALTSALRDFLTSHADSHREFLAVHARAVAGLTTRPAERTRPALPDEPSVRPGPRFGRAELEHLASGRISDVFGPRFAEQDGYQRQTRMPRPPMLLADRVTGIDAVPASMGTGTIWTETDVATDSWYLDPCGRMPAGIMVEAGQADLLLISWLGCDLGNRGERIYRLLGCELTFHGSLPAPGATLEYEIHIDGHGEHDGIRLFFFHYDCRVDGELVLSVRDGQAGFFTDAELASSGGVLWDPVDERPEGDAPRTTIPAAQFGEDAVRAFAQGRPWDCFGARLDQARTHVRTPRIADDRLLLIAEVDEWDPNGGPWGRGYLRAELPITEEDWFFDGHFENDPCMPGTLMLEGCLQAMAFHLAGLGHTLDRDGWRFEPVTGRASRMRCRGQVTPRNRVLSYEVFVSSLSIVDGQPTLHADVLCTVDGVKAFHASDLGLRLVPDWPLEHWRQLGPPATQSTGAPVSLAALGGLQGTTSEDRFGYPALLASAWGRPSEAFGDDYARFDGVRKAPRLPGPPYHFISRIVAAQPTADGSVDAEYDVPADAWYFEQNGTDTMPFAVLMEIALQPCGWIASEIGCALATPTDVLFRNLDGTATLLGEVRPGTGTIHTHASVLSVSRNGDTTIVSFRLRCTADGAPLMEMSTVFGFFPAEAFAETPGLPTGDDEVAALHAPGGSTVPAHTPAGPMLLMFDRVTGYWPRGGAAGLGRIVAELDVDPGAWFFKAHFFQDPVQPGSLGIEAMLQLLQVHMTEQADRLGTPWFEPIMVGHQVSWRYRGQVVPTNRLVTIELEVRESGTDPRGAYAIADAWLWVDGTRIYQVTGLGLRMVDADELTINPDVDTWLSDHRPTWTVPALPMMSTVDLLARAAQRRTGRPLVALHDVQLRRWIPVTEQVRLRTEVAWEGDDVNVTLLAWRTAATEALSRFEPVATCRAVVGTPPQAPAPVRSVAGAQQDENPYDSGVLFHGPSFQHLLSHSTGPSWASGVLDAAPRGVPRGLLHPGLLDAATHVIPHDQLWRWSDEIGRDVAGFPNRITSLEVFAPLLDHGELDVRATFAGFYGGNRERPAFDVTLSDAERTLLRFRLVDALVPKGRVGSAPPRLRRAFLRDGLPADGLGLSTTDGSVTTLTGADVERFDWLHGTVTRLYGLRQGTPDLLAAIAVRDHVGRLTGVHPRDVETSPDLTSAWPRGTNAVHELVVEWSEDRSAVRVSHRTQLD